MNKYRYLATKTISRELYMQQEIVKKCVCIAIFCLVVCRQRSVSHGRSMVPVLRKRLLSEMSFRMQFWSEKYQA